MSSKVSKRYAKALLSLGVEDGNFKSYGEELKEFTQFCEGNEEFFRVVSSNVFGLEDRKKVLDFVLEKTSFSGMVKNFLRLLLDKGRFGTVFDIADSYSRLTDDKSGITRAEIISARALKKKSLDRLKAALEKLTAKEMELEVSVDESIIGGIIVNIGDLVLDGSLTAQLRGLKESLKRGEYN
jgi:F-type H+-transporting ATPase subunit delta